MQVNPGAASKKRLLDIRILPQPDDVSCGPTSLHAVYDYFGIRHGLPGLIEAVSSLEGGGTLAAFLGLDALSRDLSATLYSYDLKVFDPSWREFDSDRLIERLQAQLKYKRGRKFAVSTEAYVRFLRMGGRILFDDLTPELLDQAIEAGTPVLTGLNATYLYGSKREYTDSDNKAHLDDLRGTPTGHFVVVCGRIGNKMRVADPFYDNPLSDGHFYDVDAQRLIRAILLGAMTYDANLLMLAPPDEP